MSDIDMRLGKWETALADIEHVDCLMTDGPYSPRVHTGHDDGSSLANRASAGARIHRNGHAPEPASVRRKIRYAPWTAADVARFIDAWAPRTRGWLVCLSDSELCSAYREAFERHVLTGFHPLPCVIPGMTVRMCGDGPPSWAIYANVARPKALHDWGTLPGAYVQQGGQKERLAIVGAKPLWLMRALVRDYSKPGDLVCDPCAGSGSTLLAAVTEGRRAIGAEQDEETHAEAIDRLGAGYTPPLFAESR